MKKRKEKEKKKRIVNKQMLDFKHEDFFEEKKHILKIKTENQYLYYRF